MQIQETPNHVVVYDPEGKYWDGASVDHKLAARLRQRGAVTLPFMTDMLKWSGVGGWSKRCFGAGLPLDSRAPALVGPLTLYCHPDVRGLVWAARLVPDMRGGAVRQDSGMETRPSAGVPREGMIRFAADSGQKTPMKGAYNELDEKALLVREFGDPDADGGWIVGGRGHTSVSTEGHYGYSLYATAPGLRVAWLAASVAPIRV